MFDAAVLLNPLWSPCIAPSSNSTIPKMNDIEESFSLPMRDAYKEEHKMQLALSKWQEPTVDTWPPLGNEILSGATFQCWHSHPNESWMIWFVGAPGSGKVEETLLSLPNYIHDS